MENIYYERIKSNTQEELFNFLIVDLKKYYSNIRYDSEKNFILLEGTNPICLVCSLDDNKEPWVDQELNNKNSSIPNNRYSLYLILRLLSEGYRPHLILVTNSKIGTLGSMKLLSLFPKKPFKRMKFLIECNLLANNCYCCFYDLDNESFSKAIEKFGYINKTDSFSDICNLCSCWNISGVNLSLGITKNDCLLQEKEILLMLEDSYNKIKNIIKNEKEFNYYECKIKINLYESGYNILKRWMF